MVRLLVQWLLSGLALLVVSRDRARLHGAGLGPALVRRCDWPVERDGRLRSQDHHLPDQHYHLGLFLLFINGLNDPGGVEHRERLPGERDGPPSGRVVLALLGVLIRSVNQQRVKGGNEAGGLQFRLFFWPAHLLIWLRTSRAREGERSSGLYLHSPASEGCGWGAFRSTPGRCACASNRSRAFPRRHPFQSTRGEKPMSSPAQHTAHVYRIHSHRH